MKKIWVGFWGLTLAEGLVSVWRVLWMPSEGKNAVFLGLSAARLLMGLVLLGFVVLCALCLRTAVLALNGGTEKRWLRTIGWLSLILCYLLVIGKILLTPPVGVTAFERSLSERLLPAAFWGAIFCLQSFFMLLIASDRTMIRARLCRIKQAAWTGLILFLLMGAVIGFALKSGMGLEIISGTFYRQGVSLLEGQIVLPLLALFPILLGMTLLEKRSGNGDVRVLPAILISLAVWAAAAVIWKETLFEGRSYFAPALRLPNNNFYPASDAENYDLLSQSILIGNGFRNGMTVVRPLYAAFLALLHLIAGDDYMRLTDLQIIVLALFPLAVYWIGRLISHPSAGLLCAAWVCWREVYSIRITPLVQVSNSRLLMSDLPTALLVSLVILSAILWQRRGRSLLWALISGAMIGLSMLLRTQALVLFAALLLLFFCCRRGGKHFFAQCGVALLGLCLVYLPWVGWNTIHPNESLNGDTSEANYLLTLFENAAYPERAGQKERTHDETLGSILLNHPVPIAKAVLSHFLNNEISSLLVLPEREKPVENGEKLIFDDDLFWYRESSRGVLEKNRGLTLFYLLMISLGAAAAFSQSRWVGLFPLGTHLIYNFGTALALNSGFRFILPVDWIIVFYFALGCAAGLRGIIKICLRQRLMDVSLSQQKSLEKAGARSCNSSARLFAAAMISLCVGLILPGIDSLIPYRYAELSDAELYQKWVEASEANSQMAEELNLEQRLREGKLIILQGRAVYPRYYPAGQGDSGGSSVAKRSLPYGRMVWMLNDREVHTISLRCSLNQARVQVADPQDVIVIGKAAEDYVEAISMQAVPAELAQ